MYAVMVTERFGTGSTAHLFPSKADAEKGLVDLFKYDMFMEDNRRPFQVDYERSFIENTEHGADFAKLFYTHSDNPITYMIANVEDHTKTEIPTTNFENMRDKGLRLGDTVIYIGDTIDKLSYIENGSLTILNATLVAIRSDIVVFQDEDLDFFMLNLSQIGGEICSET